MEVKMGMDRQKRYLTYLMPRSGSARRWTAQLLRKLFRRDSRKLRRREDTLLKSRRWLRLRINRMRNLRNPHHQRDYLDRHQDLNSLPSAALWSDRVLPCLPAPDTRAMLTVGPRSSSPLSIYPCRRAHPALTSLEHQPRHPALDPSPSPNDQPSPSTPSCQPESAPPINLNAWSCPQVPVTAHPCMENRAKTGERTRIPSNGSIPTV